MKFYCASVHVQAAFAHLLVAGLLDLAMLFPTLEIFKKMS